MAAGKFDQFMDSLKEQQWYQQLESSFEQLSPEQQTYARWGSIIGLFFLVGYFVFGATHSANEIKTEYFEKQELLQLVNQAGDEIRRLKGQSSGLSLGQKQDWKAVMQGLVVNQGMTPEAVEVTKESPGASQTMIQESLIEAEVKGIGLRPLVQMLYQVEHGSPPMKLKGLKVEPLGNEGLLSAKLNVSGFAPKAEKGK